MKKTILGFETQLRENSTPERAEKEKQYLKSELDFIGAPVPVIRRVAKTHCRGNKELPIADVIQLVGALWKTRTHELRSVGVAILEHRVAELRAQDIDLLEDMLRRSKTWALLDWLSVGVVAPLAERSAAVRRRLDRWSKDDDFWIRRASMLALLPGLRAGEGDFERFERYAAPMIDETEFFIRKAIGWVLRETSKKRPKLVADFLERYIERVSGLTLREGSKYLPAKTRTRLLAAYKNR